MNGVVARRVVNCDLVNRLADTNAAPAGVNDPACVLLYVLIVLERLLADSALNDPALANGTRLAGVPSPLKSVRKISPGVACALPDGTSNDATVAVGVAYRPMKEIFGPQTDSRVQPPVNWCR